MSERKVSANQGKAPKRRAKATDNGKRHKNTEAVRQQTNASGQSPSYNAKKWLVCLAVVLLIGLAARFLLGWYAGRQLAELKEQLQSSVRGNNWQQVELLAREWAARRPQEFEPWQFAANAALELNRPDAAVEYLEAMPDGAPLDAYLQLGYLQMEALADPLATKSTCDETLRYYPRDPETHERLLYYYTMTGQRNAITREAKRALSLECDTLSTYAYLFGAKWLTFTNGYETNQRWLQTYPQNELFEVAAVVHMPSYQFLDLLAKEKVKPGVEPRPVEYAAECVQELRQKYPENLELLALETRNLCRAGEVQEVAVRLSLAVPGMAEDNRFWRFRGWYYAAMERWSEAEKAYQTALQLEPFDWATQLELAAMLRRTEGIEASMEMQGRADAGKQLMMQVQQCPALHRLEPP
ncbi:MAG: tetratricopeptide repeat protein, partial [bacterium]|nr:tetratricopeptide repeat protein [bacterium]